MLVIKVEIGVLEKRGSGKLGRTTKIICTERPCEWETYIVGLGCTSVEFLEKLLFALPGRQQPGEGLGAEAWLNKLQVLFEKV